MRNGVGESDWWQRGIIYQIYPRSFQDSNGDGIGDLPGIAQRLEYCGWLGVDAVWLSPIFPSPMADFGYDVAEYCEVDQRFGTLDDFDRLIAEARRIGLRVLLDFIPNHTSAAHPWFVESRTDRTNPRRDWYLWRDPGPDGGPPNNWLAVFGGSAWEFDQRTGQYYMHSYLKEQPDLNWREPEVAEAMLGVMRFWLERGVAGFRIDAISRLIKDSHFRDNPPNPDYDPAVRQPYHRLLHAYSTDQPELLDVLRKMRAVADDYRAILVGEAYLPVERLVHYYGSDRPGLHFPFNFQLLKTRWTSDNVRATIDTYEAQLPAQCWPNWVLGNHDNHRLASRVGRGQTRLAAMLLLTLRGTPTLYYGDEIGMADVDIPEHLQQDPFGRNVPGFGLGRDPERTPMQWSEGPNAGFSVVEPWLPVGADFGDMNVERQRSDPSSLLTLYRELIKLRRDEPALAIGDYEPFDVGHRDVLAYARRDTQRAFLVALNFGHAATIEDFTALAPRGTLRLSTRPDRPGETFERSIPLAADEGVIVELLAH